MTAPPFRLLYTDEAQNILDDLTMPRHAVKYKKVIKALRPLRDNGPAQPGLESHRYHSIKSPGGEDVWESYVENRTPTAWRMWWIYGPEPDTITIVTIGPHP